MRRALCPVETLYVGQRSRAVLSCSVRGHLDAAALSTAFDTLTAEHPGLRARIASDGSGYALEFLPDTERPRLILRTGGPEVYDEELNSPLSVGGPLARAVLATEPGAERHLLVLTVDHIITDGHSAITLLNALWDRYGALVEGTGARPTPPPAGAELLSVDWPAPVSELLPPSDESETAKYLEWRLTETGRHPVELVPYDTPRQDPEAVVGAGSTTNGQAAAVTTGAAGTADGHRIEVRRLLLDAGHTARLRQLARETGVSVHGLVSAALLIAARHRLGGDGPRVLGCLSPVDLRSRLTPPLSPTVMVAAVSTHLQAVTVDTDTEPLALAREVGVHLRDSIERGDHFQDMRIMPEVPRNPALQTGTVIATNMGSVPGPRLPEGAEVTDVRLVPAREQYFPQAGRSPLMACVVSFDGRLAIEFPHYTACFSAAFMEALRDDVRSTLLSFAAATTATAATAATGSGAAADAPSVSAPRA
ncbi:protein kinase [Streptomyces sp. NPDC058371]|uniref:phthiocerol/phthiodiolone dimycocerosyl transferase family protein n=1 Tax=Streptomyces sp. NPDC058371 TaxID=3346463 RepID=UPI00364E9AD5